MANFFSNLPNKAGFITVQGETNHIGKFDLSLQDTAAIIIMYASGDDRNIIINGLKNTSGAFHTSILNVSEIQTPSILGVDLDSNVSGDQVVYGVTGTQRVNFFGSNTIRNSNKNLYHIPVGLYGGDPQSPCTWTITTDMDIPIIVPPSPSAHQQIIVNAPSVYLLPSNFSPYMDDFGTIMSLESMFATTETPYQKTLIYHDIYIDGSIEPITIYTHHNVKNGNVVTNIQMAIGTSNVSSFPDAPYSNYGSAQFDIGFMKDYSNYSQLYAECVQNCNNPGIATQLFNSSIILRFRDDVTTQSGTVEKYSKLAFMNKNGTHDTKEPLPVPPVPPASDPDVIVRFFSGKPSDEDREKSDDGTSSTNFTSGGSRKGTGSDYSNPQDTQKGSSEGSVGLFHDAYLVDDLNIRAIRNNLWTQSYFDVLKVNENPIDNIVSCKRFPFEMTTSGAQSIRVGNIDLGINGNKITTGVYTKTFNPIEVVGQYANFLDFAPHTHIGIYLPFIGFTPLDTNTFMGKWLKVEYMVDIVSGSCKAVIYRAETQNSAYYPIMEREGTMGVDCTLSASTQKQSEIANYTRLGNAGIGIASGLLTSNPMQALSGMQGITNNSVSNSFQSTSSNAPISNSGYIECFLVYDYPVPADPNVYPSSYLENVGMPNMGTFSPRELGGYVKCTGDIKLKKPAANQNITTLTREEEMEIKSLMQSGIIV